MRESSTRREEGRLGESEGGESEKERQRDKDIARERRAVVGERKGAQERVKKGRDGGEDKREGKEGILESEGEEREEDMNLQVNQ